MSHHHVWDSPLLLVAAIAGFLGLGLGVGDAMEWSQAGYHAGFSWGLGGASLVFSIGHAIGVGEFELPHFRLVLLAIAVFFIQTFLFLVLGCIVVIFLWGIVQAIAEGGIDF